MSKNFPLILEGYYTFGETFGDTKARQIDLAVWAAKPPKVE